MNVMITMNVMNDLELCHSPLEVPRNLRFQLQNRKFISRRSPILLCSLIEVSVDR